MCGGDSDEQGFWEAGGLRRDSTGGRQCKHKHYQLHPHHQQRHSSSSGQGLLLLLLLESF